MSGARHLSDGLLRTIEELVRIGEKRVGTVGGALAAAYVRARFESAGLDAVREDPFHFPRHDVEAAHLAIAVGGQALRLGFDVLEGAGPGALTAPVVACGFAGLDDLARVDVSGRVALVERNPLFHRSTQYDNVARAGAAAMIVVSQAPSNLRQVGSVRRAWEAYGPIPAVAIGQHDGRLLSTALAAGELVLAELALSVTSTRARGANVLGHVRGERAGQIVVGAHFDAWFGGATDNAAGVAALIALAERRAALARAGAPPRHTLTFVAWDGEEIALYGGYHFLRRHVVVGGAPVLAVLNFETPSAHGAQAYGLARSNHAPLDAGVRAVGLDDLFAMTLPMELVPELFGGVIPTDIQGLYRHGTPALSTAVDSPYYHTVEDTADKVDLDRLGATVEGFDALLARLDGLDGLAGVEPDPHVWRAEVLLADEGDDLALDVAVTDGRGAPQPGATVEVVLLVDDFFERATARATVGLDGFARVRLDGRLVRAAPPRRFLHVTAGRGYPRVERVIPLDN